MNIERWIGSRSVRAATAVLACLAGLGLYLGYAEPAGPVPWLKAVGIGCALLALLGGIHCSRRGYALWMRLAKILSEVMSTLVFGVCYFVLVPLFVPVIWMLDPLRLRRNAETSTFWHQRPTTPANADQLRRMG